MQVETALRTKRARIVTFRMTEMVNAALPSASALALASA